MSEQRRCNKCISLILLLYLFLKSSGETGSQKFEMATSVQSMSPDSRPLLWTTAKLLATNTSLVTPTSGQMRVMKALIKSSHVLPELRGSASVSSLVVYRPQADPLVLGSGSQQSLFGVLVVREGHTLHHVGMVLKHRQRSQLLPPENPHPMVPAC